MAPEGRPKVNVPVAERKYNKKLLHRPEESEEGKAPRPAEMRGSIARPCRSETGGHETINGSKKFYRARYNFGTTENGKEWPALP